MSIETFVPAREKYKKFKRELEDLINKNSLENFTNTPDFILADYIVDCLISYEIIKKKNDSWHGKS